MGENQTQTSAGNAKRLGFVKQVTTPQRRVEQTTSGLGLSKSPMPPSASASDGRVVLTFGEYYFDTFRYEQST